MATTDTKYGVSVPLDPTSPPTADQKVIWDSSAGRFDLAATEAGSVLQCTAAQNPTAGTINYVVSGVSDTTNSILTGQFYGKVSDGSRYQIVDMTIGWEDNDDTTTTISIVEKARYPESRVIFNINSFSVSWDSTTQFTISWSQFLVGSNPTTVTYCMNYLVF